MNMASIPRICNANAKAINYVTITSKLVKRTEVYERYNISKILASSFSTNVKMSQRNEKILTLENINSCVREMEYAVRGPLVIRAAEIQKNLKEQREKKPFDEVIRANIGDAHAMGQKPITFFRQILALASLPELLEDDKYPSDVKERVREVLEGCQGESIGSYTDSTGIEVIRKNCAKYIERRDGHPSDFNDIILSGGASNAITSVLTLLNENIDNKKPGIMIPIPQYPLYSASCALLNMHQISYYLDEDNKWALDISELQRSLEEAKQHCNPRAIVIINPGNPTGQVLSRDNVENVIKFAYKEKLFILADEVYQDNIYEEGCKFYSFKGVLKEMGPPYSDMELASFMSSSKGYMGECGLRGGYGEVINLDSNVKAMLFKMISAMLCPTVHGQISMNCVVNPPQPGEPSYEKYIAEKTNVLNSLAERAKMIAETFNSIPGIKCNPVQGAMYAFPKLELPAKAIEKAKSLNQCPSVFYAFQLLENTGICVVPGAGFGQIPGTYHFRTTILPQPDKLKSMLQKFKSFHLNFVKEYE